MKIKVGQHKCEIIKSPVNEKEINITEFEFEFDESITNDYVKEAYFTYDGNTYKQIIINNKCDIPSEVLENKGQVEVGVVAYLVENEEEIKRYNPSPAYFSTLDGSLKENAKNSKAITPSEMEQYEQALNDGLAEVENVDIDAEKVGSVSTVTITNRNGVEKSVNINDGEDGYTPVKGVDYFTQEDIESLNIPNSLSDLEEDSTHRVVTDSEKSTWNSKQDELVSGTNIKTINNMSILGSGNMDIQGGGGGSSTDVQINGVSVVSDNVANIKTKTAYNESTNKIATESDIPSLSGYIKDTDYASDSKGGVVKIGAGLTVNATGNTIVNEYTYSSYTNLPNYVFIGKGTLENVLTGKGYTTNTGTITSVKMNGSTVSSSGEADLGTVITQHQDISGKQDVLVSGTNIKTINNTSLLGSGDITISGGGSTPIVLTYSNYSGSDIVSAVDDAYQKYTNNEIVPIYYSDRLITSSYKGCVPMTFIRVTASLYYLCSPFYYSFDNSNNKRAYHYTYSQLIISNGHVTGLTQPSTNKIYTSNSSGGTLLTNDNTTTYTPTGEYNPASKKYVDELPTTYTGYDASKTQVLKNISGTLTWVDE